MIVRILDEGQYQVDNEDDLEEIGELDAALLAAIKDNDEEAFKTALDSVLEAVRRGSPVPPENIVPSELVVPHEDATIEEVRTLLESEDVAED